MLRGKATTTYANLSAPCCAVTASSRRAVANLHRSICSKPSATAPFRQSISLSTPVMPCPCTAVCRSALWTSTAPATRFASASAPPGTSYVFNAAGQSIDLAGLPCLFDAEGPCANAVKDAQRTKTGPATRRTLSLIWGTFSLPDRAAALPLRDRRRDDRLTRAQSREVYGSSSPRRSR